MWFICSRRFLYGPNVWIKHIIKTIDRKTYIGVPKNTVAFHSSTNIIWPFNFSFLVRSSGSSSKNIHSLVGYKYGLLISYHHLWHDDDNDDMMMMMTTMTAIAHHQFNLYDHLKNMYNIDDKLLHCKDIHCTRHKRHISMCYANLIDVCSSACDSIPTTSSRHHRRKPGCNDNIKYLLDDAVSWHYFW